VLPLTLGWDPGGSAAPMAAPHTHGRAEPRLSQIVICPRGREQMIRAAVCPDDPALRHPFIA